MFLWSKDWAIIRIHRVGEQKIRIAKESDLKSVWAPLQDLKILGDAWREEKEMYECYERWRRVMVSQFVTTIR